MCFQLLRSLINAFPDRRGVACSLCQRRATHHVLHENAGSEHLVHLPRCGTDGLSYRGNLLEL